MAKHAGNQGGRPLKFKSVSALQKKIDAYFAECDPHWIEEEYYDHPYAEATETLEGQPHGGALKRSRLRDYTQPMELQTRWMLTEQKPYLITGLCIALDIDRWTLLDYENGNKDLVPEDPTYDKNIPRYSHTVKRAKIKCQNYTEQHLYTGKSAVGAIFSLKNNYQWKDTAEVIQDTNVTVVTRNSGSHIEKPATIIITPDEDDADD